jgi:hypothetical protein
MTKAEGRAWVANWCCMRLTSCTADETDGFSKYNYLYLYFTYIIGFEEEEKTSFFHKLFL